VLAWIHPVMPKGCMIKVQTCTVHPVLYPVVCILTKYTFFMVCDVQVMLFLFLWKSHWIWIEAALSKSRDPMKKCVKENGLNLNSLNLNLIVKQVFCLLELFHFCVNWLSFFYLLFHHGFLTWARWNILQQSLFVPANPIPCMTSYELTVISVLHHRSGHIYQQLNKDLHFVFAFKARLWPHSILKSWNVILHLFLSQKPSKDIV